MCQCLCLMQLALEVMADKKCRSDLDLIAKLMVIFYSYTECENRSSPAGNRTPVSRVTGGDTHHYTTEDVYDVGRVYTCY